MLLDEFVYHLFFGQVYFEIRHVAIYFFRHFQHRRYDDNSCFVAAVVELPLRHKCQQRLNLRRFDKVLYFFEHDKVVLRLPCIFGKFKGVSIQQELLKRVVGLRRFEFEVGSARCGIPLNYFVPAHNLCNQLVHAGKVVIVDIDDRRIYVNHLLKIRDYLLVSYLLAHHANLLSIKCLTTYLIN